ncbi:unnamed protein product [Ilex paraguariensis]|uniref:Uncharacterized protein n=1 Tax=Ilex paraguariensis TaxID=185542 RepID=A0ABC8SHX6_9AQUA
MVVVLSKSGFGRQNDWLMRVAESGCSWWWVEVAKLYVSSSLPSTLLCVCENYLCNTIILTLYLGPKNPPSPVTTTTIKDGGISGLWWAEAQGEKKIIRALTILVLHTALFFMGFFSIYIRRFTRYENDGSTDVRRRRQPSPLSSSSLRPHHYPKGLDPATVKSLGVVQITVDHGVSELNED